MGTFKVIPKQWDLLNDNEKRLIIVVFGASLYELENPKDAPALLRVAYRRANKVGVVHLAECSRCCGTGNMPFNVWGGMCFKCQGAKVSYPKTTKKIVKSVEEALIGRFINKDGEIAKEKS